MRKIANIVIHCADTPKGVDFDISDIKNWHQNERGFTDVGYHFVIKLDGSIQRGRPLEKKGAGVAGHNHDSIHICYIGGKDGEDTRTVEQRVSLVYLGGVLKRMFKDAVIVGHRDFEGVTKLCPSFDAKTEYKNI